VSETPRPPPANAQDPVGPPPAAGTDDPRLARLRALLVGGAAERVDEIEERLDDRQRFAAEISEALPQAVALRGKSDRRLAQALTPALEEAIQTSVKKNPKVLIDVVFPVLGPAIRKAIAQAMSGLTESINRSVESTFTARGIKWRLEAWRTGRSYGEVVLANSLIYRVEQVLLVHRETGLLLQHAKLPTLTGEDPDLVSSMLTAIQDFARDSFHTEAQDTVEEFQVGELHVLAETGPGAVIAIAVRGEPPSEVRTRLQEALEEIHEEVGGGLAEFEGDVSSFDPLQPILEDCLMEQARPKRKSKTGAIVIGMVAVGLLAWWLLSTIHAHRARADFEDYVRVLEETPGLLLLRAGESEDGYEILGLRDPLAAKPADLRAQTRAADMDLYERWQGYQAPDPQFVIPRLDAALETPPGVLLLIHADMLVVDGAVSAPWLAQARRMAPLLGAVREVSQEANARVAALGATINQTVFHYARRVGVPDRDALDRFLDLARRLDGALGDAGLRATLLIEADAETVEGSRAETAKLRQSRYAGVATHLVDLERLAVEEQDRVARRNATQRKVWFDVRVDGPDVEDAER
jgi:OOP family OmpA-OmpF porin